MDKLKELVKECMDQLESTFPGDHFDEEEAFDIVMEMIVDDVKNYSFADYKKQKGIVMEKEWYIVEVEGEGCYCLCYDDVDGNRVVVDWDLEIRED